MKFVRYQRKRSIKEADEIQNGSGTGASDELKKPDVQKETKASMINGQISELLNQRLQRKTQYQNDVKVIEQKIVALSKQLADLGENIDTNVIEESFRAVRFSKKLYESSTNRTDEMYLELRQAFDDIDDLSYTPEDAKLKRFAKTIIGYINHSNFKNDNDKATSFEDYVMLMVNNSHLSLTKKELKMFITNLVNNLKENTMFSWIFA